MMQARKKLLLSAVSIIFVFVLSGCLDQFGEDPVAGGEYAPVIDEAYATPPTIAPSDTTSMICVAYDRDYDELGYRWSAPVGTFPNGIWGSEVLWIAPEQNGTYELTVTVSDSVHETQRTAIVDVYGIPGGGEGNQPPVTPVAVSPTNGDQGIDNTVTLSWVCTDPDGDPLLFDLYYGTSPSPQQYRFNMTESSEDLGEITYNTTYYWQVVAKDGKGHEVSGDIWSFTTGDGSGGGGGGSNNNPPGQPYSPYPANRSTNVTNFVTLSWICIDQDGDPLSYDLYFGSTPNPPIYRYNMSVGSIYLGEVHRNVTYYWKVIANDSKGLTTSGPEWTFKTWSQGGNSHPDPPGNPNPPDMSEHIPLNASLNWGGSDPDGDSLQYDVYFGEVGSSDFRLVSVNQSESTISFFNLYARSTTYVWQIIAKDPTGNETRGNQWTFTTVE
ncbi:MAG: hypothetical protein HN757_15930 [Calditrichaeota bacterium]|nr:hypothetical protein [Calditrichota bacterium]